MKPVLVEDAVLTELLYGLRSAERSMTGRRLLVLVALGFFSELDPTPEWATFRNTIIHDVSVPNFSGALSRLALSVEARHPKLENLFSAILVPEVLRATSEIPEHVVRASKVIERLHGTNVSEKEFGIWFDLALDAAIETGPLSAEIATPRPLAKLMADLGEIQSKASVLDPSCGQGTILSVVHGIRPKASLHGQDKDVFAQALAALRLIMLGAAAHISSGDSLRSLDFNQQFDCVLCDPPLGSPFLDMSSSPFRQLLHGPAPKRSESLFVALAATVLKPGGRAVLLVPTGILSRGGADESLRAALVDRQLVEGVIGLPQGVVTWTSMSLSLLVLHRAETNTTDRAITFVDSSHIKLSGRRPGGRLLDGHIKEIISAYRDGGPFTCRHTQLNLDASKSLEPRRYLGVRPAKFDIEKAISRLRHLDSAAADAQDQMEQTLRELKRKQ